ncbi:MAG: arginyltransferase [Alphaproteobacteria bacterium]
MSKGRLEKPLPTHHLSGEVLPRGPLVQLFATPPEPCPYLAGRMERKLLTPLIGPRAAANYDDLVVRGFRRSHTIAYRPACRTCDACVPVRIPVESFKLSRNMRKAIRGCADWRAEEVAPPVAQPHHYRLFQRYQNTRHDGGDMARMSFGEYRSMVEESFVPTALAEFRDPSGEVRAVTIYDRIADGLSGLYQFFAPETEASSPGSFMIVWLIERARTLGLPYVYLGYYIAECRKMAYKTRFQPLEALGPDGTWRRFEP